MTSCESYTFLSKLGGSVQIMSIVDFMKIWRHYDSDKSGYIETEDKADGSNEFRDFVTDFLKQCVGQCDDTSVQETMDFFIQKYDVNKDGKFQLSEMIQLLPVEDNFMAQFSKTKINTDDFERIFQHYDQDNSGKVEGDEIDGLIRDLVSVDEEAGKELTMDKLATIRAELLSVADMDGDGQLDKKELEYFLISGRKF
ncbi:calretinin-like [Convolutriloba macropyga]|uniref:calretinin-like n=1 Tax=Convolutriloba macropyga TaxID=536237 RepID=UPI003F525DF2